MCTLLYAIVADFYMATAAERRVWQAGNETLAKRDSRPMATACRGGRGSAQLGPCFLPTIFKTLLNWSARRRRGSCRPFARGLEIR
jgi:hypothetical protein